MANLTIPIPNNYQRLDSRPIDETSTFTTYSGLTAYLSNGTTFTITILAGSTRVGFAYPATLRDVNSVKYVENSNSEVKGSFDLTLVNVEGANGFTAISYKCYEYVPAVSPSVTMTYNVTI